MKKRGASTSALVGSLIVGLLIGAAVIYVAAPSLGIGGTKTGTGGVTTVNNGLCNGQTVHIGALNDLSKDLSAQGKGDLAGENLAIVDVNAYVAAAGCNLKFILDNNDYQLDGNIALQQLTAMFANGVQVVIGPLNSGAARTILSYANSNHIVLISPSSTSPALHVTDITNNYLFRTAPNDAAQGQAIARELLTQGVKAAVVINRDDTYGGGLANATVSFLQQDGMAAANIAGPFKYPTTTTDFSALITQMSNSFNTLNTGANAGHVAIVAVSFQELGSILSQTATQSPALYNNIPWYGSDGEAQNSILSNSSVGQFTSHVVLPSTLFNVVNNSKTLAFFTQHAGTPELAAITGGGVFYTLEGYDDVWLAAMSILSAGKNDGAAIHAVFPTVANSFFGLTGWEGLSGNDRIPGSYQIWKVVAAGGSFTWVLAGSWNYDTDKVAWTNPP